MFKTTMGAKIQKMKRQDIQKKLSNTDFQEHNSPSFWHGRLYEGNETIPRITWKSDLAPRNDHNTPSWLTASEYCDEEDVLENKLDLLVKLIKISNRTVIYSGAGISVAAGIGQAARGAEKEG